MCAKAQTVEIGIEDEGMVQILSGLKSGDQVVTTGAYALDDGSKVKVVSSSEMEKDAGGKQKPEAHSKCASSANVIRVAAK